MGTNGMRDTLPPLDPAAKALSEALLSKIKSEIQQHGPMSFARYMEMALYEPGLGYYRNALTKIGKLGDFVTAPVISPLFSYCLANQCEEILMACGGGDILEFGAGTGVMAAHILLALAEKKALPDHYYILEVSGSLKSVQAETIQAIVPMHADRVVWLTALPDTPLQGVVLANEVLDAMPVHQFIFQEGIHERVVDLEKEELVFRNGNQKNETLVSEIAQYDIAFSEGYASEINLYLKPWIKSIADSFEKGAILLIDYGFPRHEYYHPDRSMGTVMCHYQHRSHADPFMLPGLQDITAHVDFTSVAEAADENGLTVAGFTHQSSFLMNCGLLSFINEGIDEKARFLQNQQILQLTLPSEMGELFKVIGLTKNMHSALMGFSQMNQLMRL